MGSQVGGLWLDEEGATVSIHESDISDDVADFVPGIHHGSKWVIVPRNPTPRVKFHEIIKIVCRLVLFMLRQTVDVLDDRIAILIPERI
ncbi:MAG: hypothetical protein JWN75_648 [Candidatus Saccharibacteria bacterium]|nr:hypothetical protein [Candidatus Saccharibacteria bacterium]